MNYPKLRKTFNTHKRKPKSARHRLQHPSHYYLFADALHHLNVERVQPVTGRPDEVDACMDARIVRETGQHVTGTGTENTTPFRSQLHAQVTLKLRVQVAHQRLRAGRVVDGLAKSGRVDNGQVQLDPILANYESVAINPCAAFDRTLCWTL